MSFLYPSLRGLVLGIGMLIAALERVLFGLNQGHCFVEEVSGYGEVQSQRVGRTRL